MLGRDLPLVQNTLDASCLSLNATNIHIKNAPILSIYEPGTQLRPQSQSELERYHMLVAGQPHRPSIRAPMVRQTPPIQPRMYSERWQYLRWQRPDEWRLKGLVETGSRL